MFKITILRPSYEIGLVFLVCLFILYRHLNCNVLERKLKTKRLALLIAKQASIGRRMVFIRLSNICTQTAIVIMSFFSRCVLFIVFEKEKILNYFYFLFFPPSLSIV